MIWLISSLTKSDNFIRQYQ